MIDRRLLLISGMQYRALNRTSSLGSTIDVLLAAHGPGPFCCGETCQMHTLVGVGSAELQALQPWWRPGIMEAGSCLLQNSPGSCGGLQEAGPAFQGVVQMRICTVVGTKYILHRRAEGNT